ncbi:RNA 2',3'-cyclic phosphodiesterase [Rubellicoccus peritrichatus]|uniref:RNA 2',3'-cyclic phosphodiesterase n=1 Tax=Rubellicoccus peritrichatus TaxID=3080537 RepID=A0AAQ3QVS7_9BACT|nr:RNA 2',3'-cyclic phosphodiesterase [Puniceicoccus sp. CR14]WOO41943.1 RNA 2',3'-cyclic phosphodiesterase [Puniceicoccus sp. CR14]
MRLFVAIDLPGYVREALSELNESLRGMRWIMSENFHLTLFFLDEVDDAVIEPVQEALRAIDVAPFFMPVKGLGCFPTKGDPTVLWAGLGNGHPHLFQLQHRITDALFSLGFDPGERAWQPHITLARCNGASSELVRQLMKRHVDFETAPVRVTEYCLYASQRRGTRRFYELIESFPLEERLKG